MKRSILAGALVALAIAIVPSAAWAGPKWEFSPASSGPFTVLPTGAVEQITYSGSFSFEAAVGGSSTYNFKDGCSVAGEANVFNPTTPNKGEDENTSFLVSCPPNGTPPEPCKNAEAFTLSHTAPFWPSKLSIGPRDTFEKVEMTIECGTSHATETVFAVGGTWWTKVGINAFTFLSTAGTFEVLNTEFIMWGKLKVTPAKFVRVR